MPTTWPASWPRSTPPGRGTSLRALLAGLALAAAAACVLLAVGAFPQQPLRRWVEGRLRHSLGPETRIGALHVVPGRLQAELRDVVVAAPTYRLELPRVRVRLSPAMLWGGALELREVELESPRALVVAAGVAGASSQHRPLTVDRVTVTDGALVYRDPALGGDLALHGIRAHGALGSGALQLVAGGGEWRRPQAVPLGRLQARVAVSPSLELHVHSFDAGTAGSWLHLAGALGPLTRPALDLRFDASVNLAEAHFFGWPGLNGRVSLAGRLEGPPEALGLEARVEGGAVLPNGLRAERLEARLAGPSNGTIRFDARLRGSAQDAMGGASTLDATASGELKPVARDTSARWSAALVRRVSGAVGTPGAVSVEASGTASGWSAPTIHGQATGHAVSGSAKGPVRLPFEATFAVEGPNSRADLRSGGPPGTLAASLRASGSVIDRLEVHGQDVDLEAFVNGSGRLDLEADLRGSLERPTGTASIRIRELTLAQARLGDVALDLGLSGGVGRLEMAAPAVGATGDAVLRLERERRLRGSLTLERTPLAPFVPPAVPASGPPIQGQLDAVVDFDAPLDRPADADVEARVSSASLERGGWSARVEPFTLRVEEGTAQLQDLVLEVNGVRLEAAGRIGRPPAPSALEARIEADLGSLPLPSGWRAGGRTSGTMTLTGSLAQPQIAGRFDLAGVEVGRGPDVVLLQVAEGRLDLAGDRIRWDGVTVRVAEGVVTSAGELPLASLMTGLRRSPRQLAADDEARVEARWQDVQASALLAALQPGRREVLRAPLAGELRLSGGLASPAELHGTLALDAIAGTAAGMDLAVDPVAVEITAGVVTLPALSVRSGGQGLTASVQLDLPRGAMKASARGRLDLRALAPLLPATSLAGTAELRLDAAGPLRELRANAEIALAEVSARSALLPQALTGVQGRLVLAPGELRVEQLTGRLGGGMLEVSGTARPVGLALADVDLKIAGREIALQYPGEFKSRVSADLGLHGSSAALRLDGELRVERGLYDTDIFLEEALLAPDAPLIEEPSPLLRSVSLGVDVVSDRRIVIRNNLADLSVTGRLNVRGDLAEPAPFGRLEIAEGGTIFLQTRKFTVRSGSLSYEGTLEPTLSIRAETGIREPGAEEVAVTVAADGPLMKPDLALTSDPSYSEREIASLIATGRRNVALDSSAWVAGEQTAALLAGRLTRNLARGFMDLGLDEVDIQPELLARETDPGARFTFGKQLTPRVKVVYSYGLNDPENTFYQGEYHFRVGAEANARVQRDQGGIFTYGVGQRFRWGAPAPQRSGPRRKRARTLGSLEFSGDAPLPEPELLRLIEARRGDSVSSWDLLGEAERLEQGLRAAGHIEAIASARLEDDKAIFDVRAGPLYHWEVSGMPDPPDLSGVVRDARFESEAVDAGRRRLLDEARRRGHARASVEVVPRGQDAVRTLAFHVELGPPLVLGELTFPGAEALSPRRLRSAAGGAAGILAQPGEARERILAEYRREHFLTAEVDEPLAAESADGSRLEISVAVREGPRARIAAIRFPGATPPESVLLPLTRLEPGSPYDADLAQQAVQWIRDWYLRGGFAVARVTPRLLPAGADVDLLFEVDEGEATTIGEVVVTGLRRTREALVRSRVDFKSGDPLDPRRLVVLERRLLELGTFSRVQVTASQENPATVRVEVQERGPYAVAYDIRFSGEERATGVLDAEAGNLGGTGITLGARYRQGFEVREARGSLVLPALGAVRGLTLSVVQREEDFQLVRERLGEGPLLPPAADTERQRGLDLQHALNLRDNWELLYGYRFRRTSSLVHDFSQNLSSFEGSLVWDTRDDPLDARRGHLLSLSLDLAPKLLGSDVAFVRGFGQAFLTQAIGRSWTWAHGYRLGLASGLRESVLDQVRLFGRSTELFRAGGAGSLRGYATDSVGPRGAIPGVSEGGEAVLILNQELRYHRPGGLGAAAFYDAGNVFLDVADVGPRLRHSVGAGLRYVSPVGLLRLDVAFPLGRRARDRPYQWFVSLGQAF